MDEQDVRVVLLGMMGSGKTTVGRAIEGLVGWRYIDNDELLREATGHGPDELGDKLGRDGLHRLELEQLARALSMPGPFVAGAAGAVVEEDGVAEVLAGAFVVYLRARVDTLAARVGKGAGRPWLRDDPEGALRALLAPRAALYEELSQITVNVDEVPPDQIAQVVVAAVQHSSGDAPS